MNFKKQLLYNDFFDIKVNMILLLNKPFFVQLIKKKKRLFLKMHYLLKPGGKLVGLLFNDA